MMSRKSYLQHFFLFFLFIFCSFIPVFADSVSHERLASEIIAPYSLGDPTDIEGVYHLLNGSHQPGGYIIQSEVISPLPGFSGQPMNLLVVLDYEGVFIDVKLLDHKEPIFVSGLGEAPLRKFLEQYRGLSINTPMTVGTNYGRGKGGTLTYLDGVTKATASVRIAHESIIAVAHEVAKKKLKGLNRSSSSAKPDRTKEITFTFEELIKRGIARRYTTDHAALRAFYKGTKWEYDDPFPDRADTELYADFWVIDIGPPSVAKAIFEEETLKELQKLFDIAPQDEPIFMIEAADHGLVSEEFVRNTSPGLIIVRQDGLPLALRDADLTVETKAGVPDGVGMVFRIDRRLGFDPSRVWEVGLIATREHGIFQPEIGQMELTANYKSDPDLYLKSAITATIEPWKSSIYERRSDLIILAIVLICGITLMLFQTRVVRFKNFYEIRLSYLAIILFFVGFWGQGQLSIFTPLAVISSLTEGKSIEFLLYDPFSLMIWVVTIISFVFWGRALFCGWLCPFGAFQEGLQEISKKICIKQIRVSEKLDTHLKKFKFLTLAGLVSLIFIAPQYIDSGVEVEPFKTAISVFFVREYYFVIYAIFCLGLTLFISRGFCRYICPLGAVMAIGGFLRLRPWIKRRSECGSPCRFCTVKCDYKAICKNGAVVYGECLGCLECVKIFENKELCVPERVLMKKKLRK